MPFDWRKPFRCNHQMYEAKLHGIRNQTLYGAIRFVNHPAFGWREAEWHLNGKNTEDPFFDLENIPENEKEAKMTFDPTKPCQTRDGRKVRILCTDAPGDQPIVGYVTPESDNIIYPWTWSVDGSWFRNRSSITERDLVNVLEKRWVNLYLSSGDIEAFKHGAEEEAKAAADAERSKRLPNLIYLKTVEIDWPDNA